MRKMRDGQMMLVGGLMGAGAVCLGVGGCTNSLALAVLGAALLGIAYFVHRDAVCNDDILYPEDAD